MDTMKKNCNAIQLAGITEKRCYHPAGGQPESLALKITTDSKHTPGGQGVYRTAHPLQECASRLQAEASETPPIRIQALAHFRRALGRVQG
jgi:hypothetical protein